METFIAVLAALVINEVIKSKIPQAVKFIKSWWIMQKKKYAINKSE